MESPNSLKEDNPDFILSLIAEGYYSHSISDRFVLVHNPKYKDGTIDGEVENIYIVYDTWREDYVESETPEG